MVDNIYDFEDIHRLEDPKQFQTLDNIVDMSGITPKSELTKLEDETPGAFDKPPMNMGP